MYGEALRSCNSFQKGVGKRVSIMNHNLTVLTLTAIIIITITHAGNDDSGYPERHSWALNVSQLNVDAVPERQGVKDPFLDGVLLVSVGRVNIVRS